MQNLMKTQKKMQVIDKPLFTSTNSKLSNKKTKINATTTGNPNIHNTVQTGVLIKSNNNRFIDSFTDKLIRYLLISQLSSDNHKEEIWPLKSKVIEYNKVV